MVAVGTDEAGRRRVIVFTAPSDLPQREAVARSLAYAGESEPIFIAAR